MGLNAEHPMSYRRFMDENLFEHVNICKHNTHVPCGIGDGAENARAYETGSPAAQTKLPAFSHPLLPPNVCRKVWSIP